MYLPDGLHRRAREADLNLSGLLAVAVRQELSSVDECHHRRLRCEECGAHVESFDEEPDPAADDVEPTPAAS